MPDDRPKVPAAARLAAVAAARGEEHAIAGAGRHDERRILAEADLDRLAEPAALLAGTARVGAQLLAPDHDRRDRLGDLDRDAAHPAREGSGRHAVLARPRAGAAGHDAHHREARDVGAMLRAGRDARPAEQRHAPQAGRALGRRAAAHRLMQAAEHHVGQHLAHGVARRHGARPRRMQDRAFRRAHRHGGERAGIVQDRRPHDAAHAERGVGIGVAERHVDAVARVRRGAGVVDMDARLRKSSAPP